MGDTGRWGAACRLRKLPVDRAQRDWQPFGMPPVPGDDYSNAQERSLLHRHLSRILRSRGHRSITGTSQRAVYRRVPSAEIHRMREVITCCPGGVH